MPGRMTSRTFLPKPGGRDRPDRKRAMRGVESVECESRGGENHLLINYGETVICVGCGVTWADLDAAINAREASWLD